ncbi:MAG: ATP-binding cassette domain-containing protein [Pseudomonadota bacterium]
MALLTISDLCVSFSGPMLLDHVGLSVERGERICLVGRNGTGKSTLMKVIVGDLAPDSGEVARERGTVFACLPQEVPLGLSGAVFDVVAGGLKETGDLLAEHHAIGARLVGHGDPALMKRLDEIQHELERSGGWLMHREVEIVIAHMRLDPEARCESLSAGMKRRVLMARALVGKPDLLLLDEPTNHLDIDTIRWLEEYLRDAAGSLLFVTHDRMFLRRLATRIVELDRGKLVSWASDYDTYLERKEAALDAEEKQRAGFDKKLAEEEAWLRKGVRARRTRNEGRVRALMRMREIKQSLRQRVGSVRIEAQEAQRAGRLVIEVEDAAFSYPGVPIVRDFSTTIMRGDKIGIIGPNGSGKTTLLRLLLGELPLESGTVRRGTHLQVAYFDQLRAQLAEDRSVQDNICDGNTLLTIDGKQRHVLGYLQDFLFEPARARSPVSVLSGGERNRLMLAKLFAMPSNVLVFDEPTNDLDAETLDLLEEMLIGYAGTVLLVSHDRAFLNNVVTSNIVMEGGGKVGEYVGGYDDWLRQRAVKAPPAAAGGKQRREAPKAQGPRKLSFKEKAELDLLPARIEAFEKEKHERLSSMSDAKIYEKEGGIAEATARIARIEEELAAAYARWNELENRR